MKTSTKIIIDKYAGGLTVFILKNLFRIFGKRKKIIPPKTIVVCKFLGMGSIVQSTPLLQSFRIQFPEAKIIYLTSVCNKEFVELFSIVDRSIIINDESFFSIIKSSVSCIKFLLSNEIDLFVDLEIHSHFSKIFAVMSRANFKFGMKTANKIPDNVYTSVFEMFVDKPVSESYLQICKAFSPDKVIHELYSFPDDIIIKNEVLKKFGIKGDYIIVNPNASDLRIERRWPKEKFSELISKMIPAFSDTQIVLIGSVGENDYVNSIQSSVANIHRNALINTSGKLKIHELIALIQGSQLIITNDTGPMHLAFATKCPTIALFGPASPVQFTDHDHVTAIYKKVNCSPCVHDFINPPCMGDNICMKQITVEEVLKIVKEQVVFS